MSYDYLLKHNIGINEHMLGMLKIIHLPKKHEW